MVAYDGKSIVTNTLGACALVNQINLFNDQIRTVSYLHRIHKYIQRGFGLIIPGYISTEADSCIWYKSLSGPSKTLQFCDDWINYEGSKESSYSEPVDYLRVGCGSWFCLTVDLKPDRKKTMELWNQTPKRGSELNLISGMNSFDIRKSLENFKFKYNPGPYQLQGFIKSVTHRVINRFISTRAVERKHRTILEKDGDDNDDSDDDEVWKLVPKKVNEAALAKCVPKRNT
jgi:hypothetical protein